MVSFYLDTKESDGSSNIFGIIYDDILLKVGIAIAALEIKKWCPWSPV